MSLLRKSPNPFLIVFNSLKINDNFGKFSVEKSYRRGLKIKLLKLKCSTYTSLFKPCLVERYKQPGIEESVSYTIPPQLAV